MASDDSATVRCMRGWSLLVVDNVAAARYVSMGLVDVDYRRVLSPGVGCVSDLECDPTARVNASGGRHGSMGLVICDVVGCCSGMCPLMAMTCD